MPRYPQVLRHNFEQGLFVDSHSAANYKTNATLNHCNCDNFLYNGLNLSDQEAENGGQVGTIRPDGHTGIFLSVPNGDDEVQFNPIELHVRIRAVEYQRCDFCAILDFPIIGSELDRRNGRMLHASETEITLYYSIERQSKQFVFVRVIEISQNGQQGREEYLRSVVRLNRLDNCAHRRTQSPESVLGSHRKTVGNIADGESETILAGGWILAGFLNCDGIN